MPLTADDSALPDQILPVAGNLAHTAEVPVVRAPSRNTAQTEPSKKRAKIDQIVLMVKDLLETTCKWKTEHDAKAEESR